MAERPRIEQLGERREPFASLRAAVVEQVAAHGTNIARSTLVRVQTLTNVTVGSLCGAPGTRAMIRAKRRRLSLVPPGVPTRRD